MTKVMDTMVQDQDRLPAQDLTQKPTQNHVLDLIRDPVHDPGQDLAPGQAHEVDQGQEVEAVHAGAIPHLAVGHVRIHVLGRGEGPDPDLVVHITTDIKDPEVCLRFPLGNAMLGVGITQKQAIAWGFLD